MEAIIGILIATLAGIFCQGMFTIFNRKECLKHGVPEESLILALIVGFMLLWTTERWGVVVIICSFLSLGMIVSHNLFVVILRRNTAGKNL